MRRNLKDIIKNNEVFCSLNISNIKVYLNNELICNQELNPDEKLDNLYKNIKNKIPSNSTIKFEDTELTIEEAKKRRNDSKGIIH